MPNRKFFLVTEAERRHVRQRTPFQQHRDASYHHFFFIQGKTPKKIPAILTETLRECVPSYIPSAKIHWKISHLDVLGSRRHPPHWLSFKGPNYQRGVILISAGAIEGYFEGKTPREDSQGGLFLSQQCSGSPALATQKKLAYLGFQCLDHPTYSPDLAPSDYHLFPGLKKQLKIRHFSSDAMVIAAAETWLDGQYSDILSDLQTLEQRAKKCIELLWDYVE